jgi:hypothetical protein
MCLAKTLDERDIEQFALIPLDIAQHERSVEIDALN